MPEMISALTQLGWLLLVSAIVAAAFPVIKRRLEKLSRITMDSKGTVILDIEQEIEEAIAKRAYSEAEEAQDSEQIPATPPTTKTRIAWATSGRRPSGEIALAAEAGFEVKELDPLTVKTDRLVSNPDQLAAVVTNLKHGKSYTGGYELSVEVQTRSDSYRF